MELHPKVGEGRLNLGVIFNQGCFSRLWFFKKTVTHKNRPRPRTPPSWPRAPNLESELVDPTEPTPDVPYGWMVIELEDEVHVIPTYDLKPHYVDEECWCEPIEVTPNCYEHNSADGREAFEEGTRKPS